MQIFFLTDKDKKRFGDDYIKELIKAIRAHKKDSSGRLIKSLDYRLTQTASDINWFIHSEDYLTYIDQGRKKGKYPPIKAIAKWASLNSISPKAVFPIAHKIFKFGIKPTNILDKVENKVLYGKAFDTLEQNIANNIEEQIINTINNIK